MTAFLQRYNVGPRLAAAFAVLIVLSALIAIIGYRGLSSARTLVDDLVHQNMVKIRLSNDMMNANYIIAMQIRNVVLPTSSEDNLKFIETIQAARADYSKAREALYTIPPSDQGREIRAEIDRRRAVVKALNDRVMDPSRPAIAMRPCPCC